MAPVQNTMQGAKCSQVENAMKLPSGQNDIKDEPPDDEDHAGQDEDFKGWDCSAVKIDHKDEKSEVAVLEMGIDSTGKDFVKTDPRTPKFHFQSESICSKDGAQPKSLTPVPQVCESLNSVFSVVDSDNFQPNLVNDGKFTERKGVNGKRPVTREHSCVECGKTFPQASKLAQHLKIHSADKPFRCSDCGKYFALQQHLNWHSRIHSEGSYYCCPVCGKKFSGQTNLSRHLLKTHPAEKPYKCFECGKPFVQASALKRHLKVHDNASALEEIGRVDSMFLIEETNAKVMEDFDKKKVPKYFEDRSLLSKELTCRDPRFKQQLKDGEVENNLPRHLNDKQVKKPQLKSKHQKRQLTEIGAKVKRIKSFFSSEEQKGRSVLGAKVHNGHFESSNSSLPLVKDRIELALRKKTTSSDKLPLKGNGTNLDSRFHSKEEEFGGARQNQVRYGKSSSHDVLSVSFTCRDCGENFRSKASLYNHVMCHIGMKLHDCSMCGKHFSETLSLERHYIYHITGSFPQECLRCGRQFFSYHDLRDHSQTHLAEKKRAQRPVDQFKCNKCRRNFPSFRVLEAHIRSRCLEDKRPGKSGGSSKLSNVNNRENSDNHMVVDVDPHLAFPSAGYTSDGSSKEEFNYNEPEKPHSQYSSNILEDNRLVWKGLGEESQEQSLGLLDCAECGKKVSGVEAMMLHVKEHIAEKSYFKCSVLKCGKLFKDSSDLQAHVRAHAGEKPYSCSQCNKSFYLKENFDKHMHRHETWGSIATIIGKSPPSGNITKDSIKTESTGRFAETNGQLQHSSSHSTGSNQCCKTPPPLTVKQPAVEGKSKLSSYSPTHPPQSPSTSGSSYSVGSQSSSSESSAGHTQKERMCASALVQLFRVSDSINALNVGSREYRRYPRSGQCEVCLKFCSRLDKHMMVHLNQKPHLCPMCPQAFRQSEHLKRHVRARHEGNHRVFECSLCFKKLTRKDKLKEHMRNCRKIMSPVSPPVPAMTRLPISDRLFDVIPGPSR